MGKGLHRSLRTVSDRSDGDSDGSAGIGWGFEKDSMVAVHGLRLGLELGSIGLYICHVYPIYKNKIT